MVDATKRSEVCTRGTPVDSSDTADAVWSKSVIHGQGFYSYGRGMEKTPEQMREQAQQYRDLHTYMAGAVMSGAIEQIALALEQAADAIEADLARNAQST